MDDRVESILNFIFDSVQYSIIHSKNNSVEGMGGGSGYILHLGYIYFFHSWFHAANWSIIKGEKFHSSLQLCSRKMTCLKSHFFYHNYPSEVSELKKKNYEKNDNTIILI